MDVRNSLGTDVEEYSRPYAVNALAWHCVRESGLPLLYRRAAYQDSRPVSLCSPQPGSGSFAIKRARAEKCSRTGKSLTRLQCKKGMEEESREFTEKGARFTLKNNFIFC